jgi:hypothetical protein
MSALFGDLWSKSVDARVWSEKWMETIKKHPDIATDEGAMLGWFANAIMAGHDNASSHLLAERKEMLELLREVEWAMGINGLHACPVCLEMKYLDKKPLHTRDCRLAAMIAKLEAE